MDESIRKALTWVVFGISFLMVGYTAMDLNSAPPSTGLWLGLFGWLIMLAISTAELWLDRKKTPGADQGLPDESIDG